MSKQQLHDTQIGAVIQQMRGERVAEHVRRKRLSSDARANGVTLDQSPKRLTRERRMTLCQEYVLVLRRADECWTRLRQVMVEPCDSLFAERNEPFLATFAHHAHDAFIHPDLRELEPHQFRHAQAGRI